jgi:hypothetical protein
VQSWHLPAHRSLPARAMPVRGSLAPHKSAGLDVVPALRPAPRLLPIQRKSSAFGEKAAILSLWIKIC